MKLKKYILCVASLAVGCYIAWWCGVFQDCGDWGIPPWSGRVPSRLQAIFNIRDALNKVSNTIRPTSTNFQQVVRNVQARYPEAQGSPEGRNPFPGLLPPHDYATMERWDNSITNVEIPIIWTEVSYNGCSLYYISHKRRESGFVFTSVNEVEPAEFEAILLEALRHGAETNKPATLGSKTP